mgnify:CR=1 FL=1
MDTEDKGQSGYYQTIAREFLARRGYTEVETPVTTSLEMSVTKNSS